MLSVVEAIKIVKSSQTVAIVGLSPKKDRPSYLVADFLQRMMKISIIPVNPTCDEVLNQKCKKSLAEIGKGEVDWIDFFVNPSRLAEYKDDVIRIKPRLVWGQLGVVDDKFAQEMQKAGIPYIMDRCPKIEWDAV